MMAREVPSETWPSSSTNDIVGSIRRPERALAPISTKHCDRSHATLFLTTLETGIGSRHPLIPDERLAVGCFHIIFKSQLIVNHGSWLPLRRACTRHASSACFKQETPGESVPA